MDNANPHECTGGTRLIFACSGGADVGEISDRVARKLTRDGVGTMFCLAGIGGRVGAILDKTRAASRILAIDGCSLDCARKSLELAGFTEFQPIRITDLGMEKGQTPPTIENVETAAEAIAPLLG